MKKTCSFWFHGALNDFLSANQKGKNITYGFSGAPAVKDAIEALGVPHPEVDVILVNAAAVNFKYLLNYQGFIEVYPANIGKTWPEGYSMQVQEAETQAFILDVHLGKLARALRLLGFDSIYQNDYDDKAIAQRAVAENRIILTRDIGLLKQKIVERGYWLRSQHLEKQLSEVISYFSLPDKFQPFSRCLVCNGLLEAVPKANVLTQLPPKTKQYFEEFHHCQGCGRVFWQGSHFERMLAFVQRFQNPSK